VDQGVIKQLGISNIYQPDLLEVLINEARIPVSVVQNR
jgi:diketogulonate reductase-like aldo/keto reductase